MVGRTSTRPAERLMRSIVKASVSGWVIGAPLLRPHHPGIGGGRTCLAAGSRPGIFAPCAVTQTSVDISVLRAGAGAMRVCSPPYPTSASAAIPRLAVPEHAQRTAPRSSCLRRWHQPARAVHGAIAAAQLGADNRCRVVQRHDPRLRQQLRRLRCRRYGPDRQWKRATDKMMVDTDIPVSSW